MNKPQWLYDLQTLVANTVRDAKYEEATFGVVCTEFVDYKGYRFCDRCSRSEAEHYAADIAKKLARIVLEIKL